MNFLHFLQHWFAIHTGTVDEPGPYYGFWSGFGSDIGEIAIIGGLWSVARKHNCHVKWCWRIGKHAVAGTPWVVCRKHHPAIDEKPTADDVAMHHRAARRVRRAKAVQE